MKHPSENEHIVPDRTATPRLIPLATYRLQFNRDFGFAKAAALAPYLAALGVSHVYCSPYLRARPKSAHGYDIVNHNELNPDLGDQGSFDDMVAAFRKNGLGQILDFVPNHMGVGGADNPWWLSVLEWGEDSEFAGWFDIDWRPDQPHLKGKLLIPFLGEQYGAALETGDLTLKFDAEAGSLAVWAYDTHKLPICPVHYGLILGDAHPELERLGDAFSNLRPRDRFVGARAAALQAQLAEGVRIPEVAAGLARSMAAFRGQRGVLESWSRLGALIDQQHWRPAYFRVAGDDINYRRFFDVNDLARIRMELPEVFDHAHALIFRLLDEGALDGLRIDHIDGLFDPKRYCTQLSEKAPRPFYLVVEKILARHEELREDWEVDGATGYEVARLITGLLVDPAGERSLTQFCAEFTGDVEGFGEIARFCKIRIMENELASELNSLSREIAEVARSNPRTADFTKNVLQCALKEVIAVFPVYRTYIDEGASPTPADRRDLDWAIARARRQGSTIDGSVFDFLHRLLTCDLIAEPGSGFSRVAVTRIAMKVQQYTGPVMAKGVEDTAFYRYSRFLALNEVGGNPAEFHIRPSAFHEANERRARCFPHAMISTSTHDTKRGEDTRARLAVLSECADEWAQAVKTWSRILRAGEAAATDPPPPDRNDEYLFYQHLVGSWPPDLSIKHPDHAALEAFRSRIEQAMIKAMREAKRHTTWASPNSDYEDAVRAFIGRALDGSQRNSFLDALSPFLRALAERGMRNSLVQTVLKMTLPGVPDIYQGAELWDFNFVDPDNRRQVDYQRRQEILSLVDAKARGSEETIRELLANWRDGSIKLLIASELLKLRRRLPRLFQEGAYLPISNVGGAGDREEICVFSRTFQEEAIVVAVSLGSLPVKPGSGTASISKISLPEAPGGRRWANVFGGRYFEGEVDGQELFASLPFAVLLASRIELAA